MRQCKAEEGGVPGHVDRRLVSRVGTDIAYDLHVVGNGRALVLALKLDLQYRPVVPKGVDVKFQYVALIGNAVAGLAHRLAARLLLLAQVNVLQLVDLALVLLVGQVGEVFFEGFIIFDLTARHHLSDAPGLPRPRDRQIDLHDLPLLHALLGLQRLDVRIANQVFALDFAVLSRAHVNPSFG